MNFLANAIEDLQNQWLERLGNPRKGSLQEKAIALLPGSPVINASRMSSMLEVNASQAIRTLNVLADSGILDQATPGKRNRIWLANEIIRMLNEYEFSTEPMSQNSE